MSHHWHMKRMQAYQFELRTNGEQRRALRQYAGHCRFVYNHALALQQRYYRRFKKHVGYVRLANRLPKWKSRYPFLADAHSQALQQTLKNLDQAWKNFFAKRAEFPRFKEKGQRDSFRYRSA